jgi:putative ABC transport system ATP-binding protein
MSFILLEGAARTYKMGEVPVAALRPTDLSIDRGEFVVILGPSGSGKTTLLNLIAGIDSPTQGHIYVDGEDISGYDAVALTDYRRKKIGVIFQFFNLIPTLTALENVELVAELLHTRQKPLEVLEAVGLAQRANHFPHELSGGEQQRVAIARALVKDPPILLGDEPTGNLDVDTGRRVVKLLCRIHQEQGKTVLVVTHNPLLAQVATRVISLRDGRIRSDQRNPHPADPDEVEF